MTIMAHDGRLKHFYSQHGQCGHRGDNPEVRGRKTDQKYDVFRMVTPHSRIMLQLDPG